MGNQVKRAHSVIDKMAKHDSADATELSVISAVTQIISDLILFYRCFFYFLFGGKLEGCPYFTESRHAQTHIFSLSLIFYLWAKPHYRSQHFQEDLQKNLSNVAIPGTGVPLSVFCAHRLTAYFCVLVVYPLACLAGALNKAQRSPARAAWQFRHHLTTPTDWFAFWQLNCRLISYHYAHTKAPEFAYEDKWAFLQLAKERGVPVTPWLDVGAIMVKHRNEEGGLGIHKYGNAAHGGDWIIQEFLQNSAFLMSLLPANAPLSTFRVITASAAGMGPDPNSSLENTVSALSCVLRAGRAGATTDHSCVLFDVDVNTGRILQGTSNAHWYQRGLDKPFNCPWQPEISFETHPDSGKRFTGVDIPDFDKILEIAKEGHRLFPRIPICGWDVALTDKGMFLVEVNFSCNFFQATFDRAAYFDWAHRYFVYLQHQKLCVAPSLV